MESVPLRWADFVGCLFSRFLGTPHLLAGKGGGPGWWAWAVPGHHIPWELSSLIGPPWWLDKLQFGGRSMAHVHYLDTHGFLDWSPILCFYLIIPLNRLESNWMDLAFKVWGGLVAKSLAQGGPFSSCICLLFSFVISAPSFLVNPTRNHCHLFWKLNCF